MPWNVTRSTTFVEKEVLKFATGLDAIKSVVLDASSFPMPTDRNARNVVQAGTILGKSVTAPTKYTAYASGAVSGPIQGILAHSVEILASATAGDEAVPMFYHQCVFATPAIIGFTNHAANLVASLPTCKFE